MGDASARGCSPVRRTENGLNSRLISRQDCYRIKEIILKEINDWAIFENYCMRRWEMAGVGKRGGRKFSDYLAIAEVVLREAAKAAGEAELAA